MSEADTVPEDVRKLAGDTATRYNSQGNRSRGIDERLSLTECIERAIMADRAAWNRRAPIAEGMDRVPRWHMDTVQHQMVQHGYGEYVRWDDFRAMLAASTKEG